MPKSSAFAALSMAALVTACVAGQRRSMSGEVFQHPERFVGQAVSLCGYIHDRLRMQISGYHAEQNVSRMDLGWDLPRIRHPTARPHGTTEWLA